MFLYGYATDFILWRVRDVLRILTKREKMNWGGKSRGARRRFFEAVQALEQRVLLSGSISGTLWNDANGNGVQDTGETGLANWTVYLDQNRNRVQDAGEATTTTDGTGHY